ARKAAPKPSAAASRRGGGSARARPAGVSTEGSFRRRSSTGSGRCAPGLWVASGRTQHLRLAQPELELEPQRARARRRVVLLDASPDALELAPQHGRLARPELAAHLDGDVARDDHA